MAYDKKKIFEQAKKVITEKKLIFVEEAVAWLPCGKTTLYTFFPDGSNELNALKEIIEENKIQLKQQIRGQLGKSKKAAELLALYRLAATPEERKMLNQSYIDHTTNGKEVFNGDIVFNSEGEEPDEE